MSNALHVLLRRYKNRGIFVDTNLLLLWFVGALDKQLIPRFKRTKQFAPEDFDTLDRFVAYFKTRVTLPNVLTEVSNLAAQLGERAQSFFTDVFSKAIRILDEQYVPSVSVIDDSTFPKFGLTDCCIMSLVRNNYLLLTDDFRLSQFFSSVGGHAINFNHIRLMNWRQEG
jgi:hypothetical protein